MSNFCTIPQTKLFNQIKKAVGDYNIAADLYCLVKTATFQQQFTDQLIFNQEGEPTFESLQSILNFNNVANSKQRIAKATEELNFQLPSTNVEIVERAVKFNQQNTDLLATVEDLNNGNSTIRVELRTKDNQQKAIDLNQNLKTFKNIDLFLKSLGVNIKILDPHYMNAENALFIPQNVNHITNGLFGVINLANNMKGFQALPEEFGHFIIECLRDHPIIQRAEQQLQQQPELLKSILGNEFEVVTQYYNQKQRPDLIAREALGRLICKEFNHTNTVGLTALLSRSYNTATNFIQTKFKITQPSQSKLLDNIRQDLVNTVAEFLQNDTLQQQSVQQLATSDTILANTKIDILQNLLPSCDTLTMNLLKYVNIYSKQHTNIAMTQTLQTLLQKYVIDQTNPMLSEDERKAMITELCKNPKLITDHTQTLNVTAAINAYSHLITNSTDIIKQVLQTLQRIKNNQDNVNYQTIIQHSHDLMQMRNLILAYKTSIRSITNETTQLLHDEQLDDDIKTTLFTIQDISQNLDTLLHAAENNVYTISKQTLIRFYQPFFDMNGETELKFDGRGLEQDRVISLIDAMDYLHGDVNWLHRMLDTGYNSSDVLTQLMSQAIKNQKELNRLNAEEELSQLDRLYAAFKGKDDLLFERDENGKLTNYYVNKYGINFAKYNAERKRVFDEIKSHTEWSTERQQTERNKWLRKHTRKVKQSFYVKNAQTGRYERSQHDSNIYIPINDPRWNSDAYSKMSSEDQAVMDQILEIKHKMDCINGLVGQQRAFQCVQKMIGSATESVITKGTTGLRNIWTHIKNGFQFNLDDVEDYGQDTVSDALINHKSKTFKSVLQKHRNKLHRLAQIRYEKNPQTSKYEVTEDSKQYLMETESNKMTNFENELYQKVPLQYVQTLNDVSMLSTSIGDTIANYILATYQHECANEIADMVELTLMVARHRKMKLYDKNGKLVNKQKTPNGQTFTQDLGVNAYNTQAYKQMLHIRNTQIYEQYKDPGIIQLGKFSSAKAIDRLIQFSTVSMLGYNPFTGLNNVNVGKIQMFIEACANKYFTNKDWRKADRTYGELLPDYIAEIASPVKTSRLYLIEKLFNAQSDWKEEMARRNFYQPTTLRVAESIFGPSMMLNAGEHMMKMSTCLAMCYGYKMLDAHGNQVSLYDALEDYDIIQDGKVVDRAIRIKKGYTKLNKEAFTLQTNNIHERSDLRQFVLRMNVINHRMHGIFNTEDLIEMKKYAWGRLLMMYRNFMFPYLSRRWKGVLSKQPQYNFQTGEWERGYYTTTLLFLRNMISPVFDAKQFNGSRFQIIIEHMSKEQKQDLRRCLAEILITLAVSGLILFVFPDWDDDEGEWFMRSSNYFLRRLQMELTFGYSVNSLLDIINSPTPVMGILQDWARVLEAMENPHILQTGPYKGESNVIANIKRAMPIIPNIKDFFNMDNTDMTDGRFAPYRVYHWKENREKRRREIDNPMNNYDNQITIEEFDNALTNNNE